VLKRSTSQLVSGGWFRWYVTEFTPRPLAVSHFWIVGELAVGRQIGERGVCGTGRVVESHLHAHVGDLDLATRPFVTS